jgi:hypothetical protein
MGHAMRVCESHLLVLRPTCGSDDGAFAPFTPFGGRCFLSLPLASSLARCFRKYFSIDTDRSRFVTCRSWMVKDSGGWDESLTLCVLEPCCRTPPFPAAGFSPDLLVSQYIRPALVCV